MTLVATLMGDGLPVLFGDLLVSGFRGSEDTPLHVPTVGKISTVGTQRIPTGLIQKLTVINDGLAIGWAGSRIAATTVVRQLLDKVKDREVSNEELAHFFDTLDDIIKRELQVVGLIRRGESIESFSSHGARVFSSPIGRVRAAGFGAEELELYSDNLGSFEYSTGHNPILKTIGAGLGLISHMMGREFVTLDGLMRRFYGGGFEVVSYEGGGLKKIGDFTFLFWNAQQQEENEWLLSLPIAAINYSYRSDLLLIRSLRFEGGSLPQPSVNCTDHELYLVRPIHRLLTESDIDLARERPLPSFNSRVFCHIINAVGNTGNARVLFRMDYGRQASNSIQFVENEEGGVIGVDFNGEFLHALATRVVKSPTIA